MSANSEASHQDGDTSEVIPLRRGPGRPKKVEPKPTDDDLRHHAAVAQERAAFIAKDNLVRGLSEGAETTVILRAVLVALASEAASLLHQRVELEARGRDSTQTSSRRVETLRRIAEIELRMHDRSNGGDPDLSSEGFQRIFACWVDRLRVVAQQVMPPETLDLFFSSFASALEGWEEEAASLFSGASLSLSSSAVSNKGA
jgi:hypothetical protein